MSTSKLQMQVKDELQKYLKKYLKRKRFNYSLQNMSLKESCIFHTDKIVKLRKTINKLARREYKSPAIIGQLRKSRRNLLKHKQSLIDLANEEESWQDASFYLSKLFKDYRIKFPDNQMVFVLNQTMSFKDFKKLLIELLNETDKEFVEVVHNMMNKRGPSVSEMAYQLAVEMYASGAMIPDGTRRRTLGGCFIKSWNSAKKLVRATVEQPV